MAGKKRTSVRRGQRVVIGDANDLSALLFSPSVTLAGLPEVSPVEDRREFYPGRSRPPRLTTGVPVRRLVEQLPRKRSTVAPGFRPGAISFPSPRKVMICIRRKARRAVLFARKRTRKGSGARVRRRNLYSGVSCRVR